MPIVFDTINIVLSFVVLIYIIFLYLIFTKTKNVLIKNSYSFAIFSILLWTVSMILYRSAPEISSLFWCKVLYVSATFTASSFFIFSIIFPKSKIPHLKLWLITILANFFIVLLVLLSDSVIRGVVVIPGAEKEIIWGPLYVIYSLYISLFFLMGLIVLFKKYLREYGRVKNQIKFVFWGYFIGSNLAMITNMMMVSWGDFRLNWLGQILSVIMVAFTVYAIITHRLMDIKFVMRRYSVYLVSMILVLIPLFVIKYLVNLYLPLLVSVIDVIVLFVAVLIFPPIKNVIYNLANKFFFSSLYDSRKIIVEVSDKLRSTLNINQLYNYIYDSLNGAMHVKAFGILRYRKKKKCYSTEFNVNFNIGRRVNFEKNDTIQEYFMEKNIPLIIAEAGELKDNPKTKETLEMLHRMKVEILMPLNVKDNVVGMIVMGAKESGDMYNDEDLQILKIVASQSAIAIENAMLYEETKNFSVKMEEEVKRATADLRAANKKLKKLDEAKSEFISIASHQLRTPLTVIKGYISMMMEGSFGKLSRSISDPLEKVYESNERLINLVENLLNISRIESGRLRFNFQTIQLEKMIESVIEELSSTAEVKGVLLEFKKLKSDLPKIMVDKEKIRQVIMNLVDNAIKYSVKGVILITLRKRKGNLIFCIRDNGLGIDKSDMPNLFKKFIRGNNAMLTHTEGTGLGLFVAKQMIESHQGRIWAESKGKNKGTKFCFELPIVDKDKN